MKNFFYFFGVVFLNVILMHVVINKILLPLKWHPYIAVVVFIIITNYIFKFLNFIREKFIESDLYEEIYYSNFFENRRNNFFTRFANKSSIRSLIEILMLVIAGVVILRVTLYLAIAKEAVGIVLFAFIIAFLIHYSFSLCEIKYDSNIIEVEVKNFLKKILQMLSILLIIALLVISTILIIKSIDTIFSLVILIIFLILFNVKIVIPAIIQTRREARENNVD